MATRAYHHGNLRAALLEQAEQSVRMQGVDRLSLRELARQVGVSHAAPRRHFPDRQALLNALAEVGFTRLGAELRQAMDQAGEQFEARLLATANAYVRFATRDAALLELMFAGKYNEPSAAVQEAALGALSVLLELVEQGQAEGVLEPGEPGRVGLVLLATVQGIAAVVNGGIVDGSQSEALVADAITLFTSRSRGTRSG
ncbi:MAG TPA: TetR/AcrR family transcriptional regulator [Solirubrobacteraceae bacterium]|jgi:AcrR family transcriptional regulator